MRMLSNKIYYLLVFIGYSAFAVSKDPPPPGVPPPPPMSIDSGVSLLLFVVLVFAFYQINKNKAS